MEARPTRCQPPDGAGFLKGLNIGSVHSVMFGTIRGYRERFVVFAFVEDLLSV